MNNDGMKLSYQRDTVYKQFLSSKRIKLLKSTKLQKCCHEAVWKSKQNYFIYGAHYIAQNTSGLI